MIGTVNFHVRYKYYSPIIQHTLQEINTADEQRSLQMEEGDIETSARCTVADLSVRLRT